MKKKSLEREHAKAKSGRGRQVPVRVRKSDLLTVLKSLKESKKKEENAMKVSRACSEHQFLDRPTIIHSQSHDLLFAMTNSIERHDWLTAARVVNTLLNFSNRTYNVYRGVLPILLNHPGVNSTTLQQLFSEVMNLRTHSEQETFLSHLFQLPNDLDVYNVAANILKPTSLDDISDDESS